MFSNRRYAIPVVRAGLVLVSLTGVGSRADARMLRLWPCDGIGAFAKEFRLPVGSRVTGVRVAIGVPGTVFPEIVLAAGPVTESPAAPVRTVHNAREAEVAGEVTACWTEPVVSTSTDNVYHVVVRMSRELDTDRAPRVGAVDAVAPTGSYIVSLPGEAPVALGADLDIELTTGAAAKAGGNAEKEESPGSDADGAATLTLRGREGASMTTIVLDLHTEGRVAVVLFDVRGRLVRTLMPRSFMPAGRHHFDWDGKNSAGRQVARGVYVVHVTAAEERITRKLVSW